jgi:hypothetical protein
MNAEHPIEQPIEAIELTHDGERYVVGRNGVTRIEATTKSGLHADLAYVRVWRGDKALAEFCQHGLAGVYFAASTTEPGPSQEPDQETRHAG